MVITYLTTTFKSLYKHVLTLSFYAASDLYPLSISLSILEFLDLYERSKGALVLFDAFGVILSLMYI